MIITGYEDFINALLAAGFSMGGSNGEGIYSIIDWTWNESPPYDTPVKWHTGDPETDPWEWRMRVLEERRDIAYAKLFFRKSGYITADWYPYFYAVRRANTSFEDVYYSGKISHEAKRIYEVLREKGPTPLHLLKSHTNMRNPDMKSRFDQAMTSLQMRMFVTMCARQQKISKQGAVYGWFSTVFCLTEDFFDDTVFQKAASLQEEASAEKIRAQILKINPNADAKVIERFIRG